MSKLPKQPLPMRRNRHNAPCGCRCGHHGQQPPLESKQWGRDRFEEEEIFVCNACRTKQLKACTPASPESATCRASACCRGIAFPLNLNPKPPPPLAAAAPAVAAAVLTAAPVPAPVAAVVAVANAAPVAAAPPLAAQQQQQEAAGHNYEDYELAILRLEVARAEAQLALAKAMQKRKRE
jgi:hypothetical protein